jgi:hypothetical protein
MAKNKVSLLKGTALPKLESIAAVLGARLARDITETILVNKVHYCGDSQIVLYWIKNNKLQNKFFTTRINEIKALTCVDAWKYVPTDSNPADLQTRGITASQLNNNTLWNYGPKWLSTCTKELWPKWMPQTNVA